MTESKQINVIIADDHSLFIEGLMVLLQNDNNIKITGTALNGKEALALVEKNCDIDVILSDINMPDMDGIELCKQVRKYHPNTFVIALSMHDEPKIISNVLRAGATGYLLKKTNHEELLKAIKTVSCGEMFISEDVKSAMIENLASFGKKTTHLVPQLSAREKEVLNLVAKEYTTQQIADILFISSHTVISHRKKLLFKFNVHNTAGLIVRATDAGLLN